MQRFSSGMGAPSSGALALKQHWDHIGETRFAAAAGHFGFAHGDSMTRN